MAKRLVLCAFNTKDLKCIEKLIRSDVKVEENYAKTFK